MQNLFIQKSFNTIISQLDGKGILFQFSLILPYGEGCTTIRFILVKMIWWWHTLHGKQWISLSNAR